MAIVPFIPLQLPWLFDALCGQEWPAGDEDALRRCAQAWDDALKSVLDLAGNGNDTSQGVLSTVAGMSSDEFATYWAQYTGGSVSDSALGQLAAQCQNLGPALHGQAEEVEYTKLTIDVTIVLTAIQIVWALAAAVPSLGSSLAEIPLLTLISRLTVQSFVFRFVQMALMMVVPDLIAQGWMLTIDHSESSWDGNRTGAAFENAIVGGTIATLLGAGMAKLPFMGEDFGRSVSGKVIQGLGHFAEGGAVMDLSTLATLGINYGIADAQGDKQGMQQIGQQLADTNWLHSFISGGVLATTFYLPHLAAPHGTPLSFTASDGKSYTVFLSEAELQHLNDTGTLPDGYTAPAYSQNGWRVGTASFAGPDVTIDRPAGDPVPADLSSQPGGPGGFQVTGHDGSIQRWGYPAGESDPSAAQLLSYTRTSDGTVPTPVVTGIAAVPDKVPAGSVVHYTAGEDPQIYRIDFVDPRSGTVLTAQASQPGDPLQLTGRTQYDYGPAGAGKLLGIQGATYYAHDGIEGRQVASANALTGQLTFGDGALPPGDAFARYQHAFGDRYNPLAPTSTAGVPAGFHAAAAEPFGGDAAASAVARLAEPPVVTADQGPAGHESPPPGAVADGVVLESAAAGLALHQALSPAADPAHAPAAAADGAPVPAADSDWVAMASQPGGGRPAPVYGRPDTADGSQLTLRPRGIGAPDSWRETKPGIALAESHRQYESQLAQRQAQYHQELLQIEQAPLTTATEQHLLADLARRAAEREAAAAAFKSGVEKLAQARVDAERQLLAQAAADNPGMARALLDEAGRLEGRYKQNRDSLSNLVQRDLDGRRGTDLSRAYEQEEYQLTAAVAGAPPDQRAELRSRLPGELAKLSARYAELQRGSEQAARQLKLAEKAAIDEAARAAAGPALEAELARISATLPPDSAAAQEAVRQAHAAYASALSRERVAAIGRRLAELGPEDTSQATYLRRIRDEELAPSAAVAAPAGSGLTLADLNGQTPRGQAIDQAVSDVRNALMSAPRNTVSAAGQLLLDGKPAEGFSVSGPGGQTDLPRVRVLTADGASVEDRQQRYHVPGERTVGSRANRATDTEAQLLRQMRTRLEEARAAGTEPAGVLVVGSNKLVCPSCQALMHQIGGDFPGIQVVLATEPEIVVFDSHGAETHPAWVWGTGDVGQLTAVDLGMSDSRGPEVTGPAAGSADRADVRLVTPPDPADGEAPAGLTAALDPEANQEQFRQLAQLLRARAAETGRMQAIVQDAAGRLHWVEGGSEAMLSPALAGIDMGSMTGPDDPAGRIVLRTSAEPIDVSQPEAVTALSAADHRDGTLILPPDGNPVRLDWSARMDTLRSGVFIRPHDSTADTGFTGPYLDAVKRVDGQEILAGHGSEHGIGIGGGREITPEQIARVLPPTDRSAIWNALVCDLGADGKAGALADAVGRTVRAADTTVVVSNEGNYAAVQLDPDTGQPAPPAHSAASPWRDFTPGGDRGGEPSPIAQALGAPRGDLAFLGDHGPRTPPGDPLDPENIKDTLALLAEQSQHRQERSAELDRQLIRVQAALAGHPADAERLALQEERSAILRESAKLDLAEQEGGERVQLLTAFADALVRHEDAAGRLAAAKEAARQGGTDDYGSLAAYELLTRHEVADLRDIIATWQSEHPEGLLDSRLQLAQYQGAAGTIRAAAAAIDALRDPQASFSAERVQAALDVVRLAGEAGQVPGLLPDSLTASYRNGEHYWQAELPRIAAQLEEAARNGTPPDRTLLDAASGYLNDAADRADQTVARTAHTLRFQQQALAGGSTVDPLTGSIHLVPALGEPAEPERPAFSMVPAILSSLLDPRGMLAMDGVPLGDRLAASMRSADQALLRDLLDGAGHQVRTGDFHFQLAAMVKRVPYTDTHLESMPQAGLHDAQTQQVSFWPRWYDITTADGTRALLIVADNIREERSFTHEVYPHAFRAGFDAPGGALGVSGMVRVQYSDKTTFEMNHAGARAVVGWVRDPQGSWRQVSGYLPGDPVHEEVKRSAGWDFAYGGDLTLGPLDLSFGGKWKFKRVIDPVTGQESYTMTNLFGFAYNQDFGLIQHGDLPRAEIPLPDGGRIFFGYNPQKDGKIAVEVWPIRFRDAAGVPDVRKVPVNLDTPVIGPIRRWLLEHGAPRDLLPPEPPAPPADVPSGSAPGPVTAAPVAQDSLLTPEQEASLQAQYEQAVRSGDPAQIVRWEQALVEAINQAAEARIAAWEEQAAAATRAAEEAMSRARQQPPPA